TATVGAVEGLGVGIRTPLLFHCDRVHATRESGGMAPCVDLGAVPEAGSSPLAPQRMGYARAFELLVLGEPFTAERAREAGLVNAIVSADELEATARTAAARLAAKPPEALALSRWLLRGDTSALAQRVEEEARIFGERLSSPEAQEAFAAFLEKRQPDFARLKRTRS